ncbi:hypothetical protein YPPY19_1385, partial [Yersinia pestis PY-19]
MGHTPRG